MSMDDLTVRELVKLSDLLSGTKKENDDSHWEIGENYLIRTVTMFNTGRLVSVTTLELVLEDAAWIADTGRFASALVSGEFEEIEPYPDGAVVILGRGAIVDAVKISTLPREQKP